MLKPNVLILRAPGTNCDKETAFAFETAGATTETLHVNRLLESPAVLDRFQILCIPGGFSFGDDVAAGQIFAVQMRHHLAGRLADFKAAGKLILGICNGFQVIIKSGILLDDEPSPASGYPGPPATLTYNDSGKYEDRWVRLGVAGAKCVFLARHRADVSARGPWRRQVHRPRRRRARPIGSGRPVGLALRAVGGKR